jgi:hypothetical protein
VVDFGLSFWLIQTVTMDLGCLVSLERLDLKLWLCLWSYSWSDACCCGILVQLVPVFFFVLLFCTLLSYV